MSVGVVFENPNGPGFALYRMNSQTLYGRDELTSVNKLMDLIEKYSVESLWIIGTRTASYKIGATEQVDVRETHSGDGKIQCMKMWRVSKQLFTRAHFVFFATVDERWGCEEAQPAELCQAVELVERELKIQLQWSPGHTGQELMKGFNTGHPYWLAPIDLGAMPIKGNQGRDIEAKHFPDFSELDSSRPIILHIYDKKFMYGGACKSARLGAGNPEHHQNILGVPFHEFYPGMWRMPSGKWAWTPRVQFYIRNGMLAPEQLKEAWIWTKEPSTQAPRYHQTLRAWAACLWDADVRLRGYTLALKICKKIRTQALGWLAHPGSYGEHSIGYRPDIWSMIVEEAATKMEFKIAELSQKFKLDIVWVNVDEIGVLSNEPDPRQFWDSSLGMYRPHPILAREGELGGFTHRYSVLVDDEVLHGLSDQTKWGKCHDILLSKWEKTGTGVLVHG